MIERGASEAEVIATVESGERFPAKFGRGRVYANKQLELLVAEENEDWLVISLIVKYF